MTMSLCSCVSCSNFSCVVIMHLLLNDIIERLFYDVNGKMQKLFNFPLYGTLPVGDILSPGRLRHKSQK